MSQPTLCSQRAGGAPWMDWRVQGRDLRRRALWMKHPERCGGLRFSICQKVVFQLVFIYLPYMTMAADLVSST